MVHMEQKVLLTAKSRPGRWPEVGGLRDSESRSSSALRGKKWNQNWVRCVFFFIFFIFNDYRFTGRCKNSTEGFHVPFTQVHPMAIHNSDVVLEPSVTTARPSHPTFWWKILEFGRYWEFREEIGCRNLSGDRLTWNSSESGENGKKERDWRR